MTDKNVAPTTSIAGKTGIAAPAPTITSHATGIAEGRAGGADRARETPQARHAGNPGDLLQLSDELDEDGPAEGHETEQQKAEKAKQEEQKKAQEEKQQQIEAQQKKIEDLQKKLEEQLKAGDQVGAAQTASELQAAQKDLENLVTDTGEGASNPVSKVPAAGEGAATPGGGGGAPAAGGGAPAGGGGAPAGGGGGPAGGGGAPAGSGGGTPVGGGGAPAGGGSLNAPVQDAGGPPVDVSKQLEPGAAAGIPAKYKDNQVAQLIWQEAKKAGADPYAMLATAVVESGLNPKAVGDNGTSFGLYQYHIGGALGNRSKDWAFDPMNIIQDEAKRFAAAGVRDGGGAAAVQRPADQAGYAAKVNALIAEMRG